MSVSLFAAHFVFAFEIPRVKRNENGVLQLIVDGRPYVMLAGETMNSSSSSAESMAPRWGKMRDLNLNTVLLPVSWEIFEPEEGRRDFSLVGDLIKGARENGLRIVLLWFGSWKNGSSGYAPEWVMRDTGRFPRMKDAQGRNRPYLSNFGGELVKAEAKTFRAMMDYIRKADAGRGTVLMVQVENEVGLLDDSMDRSGRAVELFKGEVPAELLDFVAKNEDALLPEIAKRWAENGRKRKGSWADVFGGGENSLAEEMFMAWHYAKHVERVAAEGKAAYPLPMFVNAWTIDPGNPVPGTYPSGGPNSRMMDVWRCAAPSVDVFAADNYRKDFRAKCAEFYRNGNPLFVPEAVPLWEGDSSSGPASAFLSVAEFNAMCFSPFAIDHAAYGAGHPIKSAYGVLSGLMPLITKEHGSGNMRGFMQQENKSEYIPFGDIVFHVGYNYPYRGFGLIVRLSENEFLIAGSGFDAHFSSRNEKLPGISYGTMREGRFENGEWKTSRYVGGDEAMQGVGGIKMPPLYLRDDASPEIVPVVRIRVFPVDGGNYAHKEVFK